VNGKFDDITRQDFLAEADRFGVSRPSEQLNEVRTALETWPTFAKEAGLTRSVFDRVAADFRLL
jgi:serine/threonine-protein kinase HipA